LAATRAEVLDHEGLPELDVEVSVTDSAELRAAVLEPPAGVKNVNLEARVVRLKALPFPIAHAISVRHGALEGVLRQLLPIAANIPTVQMPDHDIETLDP
jgi:hypothetical protein